MPVRLPDYPAGRLVRNAVGLLTVALLSWACDRVVHVRGAIRGESGVPTGACKARLHDPGSWGGRPHEFLIPSEFDQAVFVDPLSVLATGSSFLVSTAREP